MTKTELKQVKHAESAAQVHALATRYYALEAKRVTKECAVIMAGDVVRGWKTLYSYLTAKRDTASVSMRDAARAVSDDVFLVSKVAGTYAKTYFRTLVSK